MAIVEIGIVGEINKKAIQEVLNINPGVRGNKPVFDGQKIICGRLTWQEVIEILRRYSADFTCPVVFGKYGRNPLSARGHPAREITNGSLVDNPTGQPKSIEELREQLYCQGLRILPKAMSERLSNCLDLICVSLNDNQPAEFYHRIFPSNLITFSPARQEKVTAYRLSMKPLEDITPELSVALLSYSTSGVEGQTKAENSFLKNLFELPENPSIVRRFFQETFNQQQELGSCKVVYQHR